MSRYPATVTTFSMLKLLYLMSIVEMNSLGLKHITAVLLCYAYLNLKSYSHLQFLYERTDDSNRSDIGGFTNWFSLSCC